VNEGELPFGRVLLAGEVHDCLFDGDRVILLDRPAYASGAQPVGEAALGDCRLLAPVQPTKVVAVGLNYRAHAEEFAAAPPSEPLLFLKPPSAVVGPGAAIVLPPQSRRVDYEAELALVVGRRCRDVSVAAAPSHVAGYTCANDVTARDLQRSDGQWTRAKSFDTFCPLGPWVVRRAPDEGARVSALIDGRPVQEGQVGDMIAAPLELLAYVSGVMTLEPGDVILTGTPPGVGPLAHGQVVTVAVDGVGQLANPVR
jgi:2-keto-4-pentenoate hydratase/2-oxohepta-3-ene-1,7-dioic acid hydratase in catechol pathway